MAKGVEGKQLLLLFYILSESLGSWALLLQEWLSLSGVFNARGPSERPGNLTPCLFPHKQQSRPLHPPFGVQQEPYV